jgi:hypothetical protein
MRFEGYRTEIDDISRQREMDNRIESFYKQISVSGLLKGKGNKDYNKRET